MQKPYTYILSLEDGLGSPKSFAGRLLQHFGGFFHKSIVCWPIGRKISRRTVLQRLRIRLQLTWANTRTAFCDAKVHTSNFMLIVYNLFCCFHSYSPQLFSIRKNWSYIVFSFSWPPKMLPIFSFGKDFNRMYFELKRWKCLDIATVWFGHRTEKQQNY